MIKWLKVFGVLKCLFNFFLRIGVILELILIFILLSNVKGFIGNLNLISVWLIFLIGLFVSSKLVVLFI